MGQELTPKSIPENPRFTGRAREVARLKEIAAEGRAAIVVVHGRRRVGKTELIEQVFRNRNILKFEGIEGQDEDYQKRKVLRELSKYANDPAIAAFGFSSWLEIFEYLARFVSQGIWTVFFEEVQWLSCYRTTFVAELKDAWDNQFRYNDRLLMVLCGSSPSFMIGKVLKSKALYNRSMHELPLKQFSLRETQEFLDRKLGPQEVMDGYLSVGGIPEYLNYLTKRSSVLLSLCENAFTSGSFFSTERDKIFVSSLDDNPNYSSILEYLSRRRFATRKEITAHLKRQRGGSLTDLLTDLELCQFIEKVPPFNLDEKARLVRYSIRDNFLQFYYKFIHERRGKIASGAFDADPVKALPSNTYYTWLGFAFERYCRANAWKIAATLGFGAIDYDCGPFYNRATEKEHPDFQIDLVFDRADRVFTLCEIKYLRGPATRELIAQFERKLQLFPNPRQRTIYKVLISAQGAEPSLRDSGYFDRILTLEDIFAMER